MGSGLVLVQLLEHGKSDCETAPFNIASFEISPDYDLQDRVAGPYWTWAREGAASCVGLPSQTSVSIFIVIIL